MKTTFVDDWVKRGRRGRLLCAAVAAALSFAAAARAADPPAVAPVPPAFTEAALLATPPPGPYTVPAPPAAVSAKTDTFSPPQVAAVFWYGLDSETGMGFRYGDGTEAVGLHPAQMKGYSYKSAAWYKREFIAMHEAGVDIALCQYWGNPADRALKPGQGLRWSFDGLGPLVSAATQLSKQRPSPKIALSFDAGSLLENAAHYQPDLATNDGRAWLYVAMRDFFSLVPPRLRATGPNHGPLIFVSYAAPFVKNGTANGALWEYVRAHFAADFGVEPYLVLQSGWQAGSELGADAAFPQVSSPVNGLTETGKIAAIGPGVNQRADPHNKYTTPAIFRDRENGAFYEKQWRKLLAQDPARRPRFVMVESWNQWQQATAIAPSREYGDKYVRLTRKWADVFHKGTRLPLPASGPYRNAARVSWFAAAPSGDAAGGGLRLVSPPDGIFVLSKTASGGAYVEGSDNPHGTMNHLYFDVNDDFMYDADDGQTTSLTLTFEYWDEGRDLLRIQYDATDSGQAMRKNDDVAYTLAAEFVRTDTHTWKTATIVVPNPRFANRQNGGADIRFQSAKTVPLRLPLGDASP